MWLSTHYFSRLLQDWFHVFLYEIKNNSVWYNFYQVTSVSITIYIFEHYQLWMMDSKGQRVFFPKTPKLCVWHTEVRSCYHFKGAVCRILTLLKHKNTVICLQTFRKHVKLTYLFTGPECLCLLWFVKPAHCQFTQLYFGTPGCQLAENTAI